MSFYDVDGNPLYAASVFVDVADFGAKGNGTADDASAIQRALDSVKTTGRVIFFPYGTYLIKTALVVYSNQTLLFTPGAKILQGASMNNLMRGYSESSITGYNGTHHIQIVGATFDGGEFTSANTLLGFCHSSYITVKNCSFRNGYSTWHDVEINSSKYVLIEDCDFSATRRTGSNAESIQIDAASSSAAYPWNSNSDGTVCQYVEIKGCHFHNNTISPGIGNHDNKAHTYVRIHDCTFDGLTSERGAIYFSGVESCDCYDNSFNNCTIAFTSARTSNVSSFHDNRVDGATTVVGDNYTRKYNNLIDGVLTQ